ncbi:PAS domain S-box protein [Peribacillus asahii]|uniref:histidine kinase n=1 Tax=Peribacillus asahii TaxID=228899 RepID=A0A398B7K2_9BACI|nr:PAS domain S-box protein [Peribacillus asahii]RID83693.1 PAS domain S-box protein [Peribacillus asahii]
METATKKSIQQKNYTVNINNAASKKVNILMVDDHPENLLALEAVLSSPNYNLVCATSGKEALKCLLKQEFAVILLDVQMPGLNGFETAKLIRARAKTKQTPIIFITAISQDREHVERGYSVGAIDYIFKPFQPEILKSKIEKFVEMHEKYEEEISKSEWQRSVELKEVNQRLNRTTLDLRRTEALTKVIGETLIDTIVTFDDQERILSVNPAVKRMFGYQPEELIEQNVSKLFLQMIGKNGEKSSDFLSLIKQGVGKVVESVALRKDKSDFPVDIQIGETEIEGRHIFVCAIRDVTERKQIEEVKKQQFANLEHIVEKRTIELLLANEKLQQEIEERKKIADDLFVSQERFRKIFESSPNLMAIISQENGTYMDVNASWVTFTGYSYEELRNQKINLQDFIEEAGGHSIDLEQPIRNMKIQYKTKRGEMRAGLLSSEMIHIEPEPCILFVLTDITERVLLEKEMARLDHLNLIGEMAAGIAHEIRNPMTTVYGFLQVARGREVSKEVIDLMLDELNRANSIITEFLNLAKNKVSDKQMKNLNTIIKALFPLIQAEAMRASKQVDLDLSECPDISIDEKEIRQFILNIALNGLDAMSSGGKLTIKTYAEEEAVILEIKDQGAGISPDILEKIGTPFFTTKEKGTGLGLAICYSVAERHQAEIDIETGDKGTTFSIRFKANYR